jgi:hypothetical protein
MKTATKNGSGRKNPPSSTHLVDVDAYFSREA